jgi:hypothetical protein
MEETRVSIQTKNADPKIAILLMTFALLGEDPGLGMRDSILRTQVEHLKVSFSDKETAKAFTEDVKIASLARYYPDSNDVNISPAYGSAEKAINILSRGVRHYSHNLKGIREMRFSFLSDERANEFTEAIESYIKIILVLMLSHKSTS